jgi:hypothetical protein
MPHLFEGMTREEADKRIIEIGEEYGVRYEDSFRKLQQEILKYDPIYCLSINSFYSTLNSNRRPDSKRILQHHIELLQSLTLRNKREDYNSRFPPPSAIQTVRDLLYECSNSFPMRRIASLDPSMSQQERERLRSLEAIRSHTQAYRNWGYPQQINRILLDLFAPLDDRVERATGVRLQSLLRMVFKVEDIIEERINSHVAAIRPALTAKSVRKAVDNYWKLIPNPNEPVGDLIATLKEKRATLQQTRSVLLSHSDLRVPEIYLFDFQDFADAYPTSVEGTALRRIIDSWAYSFGDLANKDPEHFFLSNPIWKRPLIVLEDGSYLLPVPGLFLSFCLELMEDVIRSVPNLQSTYLKRRAKFLEDEIERLFVSAFPSAKVYRGSLWHDQSTGKKFENDLLVLLDSYQIVVEAKSGKVSGPARRGAVSGLKGEIRKLMVEPSIQAKRFAEHLENNRGKHRLPTLSGAVNEFDNSECHETIRVNVTFDILANLQARWTDLRSAGFFEKDADLGPTMSLADLELIFDLLDTACEKIHYLARRAEFERNAQYVADESDLLAFYIDNGFNIGEAEYDNTGLAIYGISESLDPYFMQVWTGEKVSKPRRKYTKWWTRILESMEQQPIPRWTEIGYMLLNLSYEEQGVFEKEFRRVQRKVKWRVPGHTNMCTMFGGAEQHRNIMIGLAYKRVTIEERNNMIADAARTAFKNEGIRRTLVIGVDVERAADPCPYDVLVCVIKTSQLI